MGSLLFLGVLYVTTLVLASFGLLGPLGPVIMQPYNKLVTQMERLIGHLLR
jgi:hypothetical protein